MIKREREREREREHERRAAKGVRRGGAERKGEEGLVSLSACLVV